MPRHRIAVGVNLVAVVVLVTLLARSILATSGVVSRGQPLEEYVMLGMAMLCATNAVALSVSSNAFRIVMAICNSPVAVVGLWVGFVGLVVDPVGLVFGVLVAPPSIGALIAFVSDWLKRGAGANGAVSSNPQPR